MARAEIEQEIQQLDRQIQQLTRQLVLLRGKLAKEPLSLDTWVCWDVWTQQGTRLTKVGYNALILDQLEFLTPVPVTPLWGTCSPTGGLSWETMTNT